MRVPAFQPAPHVNLDQFERHLRGQGVQQPSLEDPLSEWAGQAESSGRPSPSPPKSAANVPAPVGAGGSPTAAFATGAPWPSAETDEQPIESLDAELGALQANDDDLQTWDTGLSDEVIEDRFRSRRLIAPALALAGVLIIGSALALKVGVLGPVKQPPFVAATAPKAELKPAKDETVASSADTGSPLLKENIQSTETKVVREQPAGSSAVDETPTAATVSSAIPAPVRSAEAGQTTSPSTPSPDAKPLRTVSLRPDGTPIETPVSTEFSSPTDVPKSAAPSVSAATNNALGIELPVKSDSPTKRPPPKSPPRIVVVKTEATRPAMTTETGNRSLLPETPLQPDKAATEPNSPQAATAPIPPSAAPGEAARQSFTRVVNTFGGLFGATTPPAAQSDPVSSSAGWAVQLAAPKSETEARNDLRRLNAKYASALKGSKIGVHKATVDGETIYRLRIVDLSKADASALCARLKDDGGNCFVAR